MPRATRDAKLETRTARIKLKRSHEPYWIGIGLGLALGYRKGVRSGKWIARQYKNNVYHKIVLGEADDFRDANDREVLNYFQAQAKARKLAEETSKQTHGPEVRLDLTIGEILDDYLRWFELNRKSLDGTRTTIEAHLRPALGAKRIHDLTTRELRTWFEGLVSAAPRRRRSRNIPVNVVRLQTVRPDRSRQRKATANRILNVLKAALNRAWEEGLIENDSAWRRLAKFENVDHARIRYLNVNELKRLLKGCSKEFHPLAYAALLSGARYGELIKSQCSDYNPDSKTLRVVESKTGGERHIPLTKEGVDLFETLTEKRPTEDLIFIHADGKPWGRAHQTRPMRQACKKAKISPPISFHILRHTYASLLAMRKVPLSVIAELLGHKDLRMTKKHYAHLTPGFVAAEVRAALPRLRG